MTLTSLKLAIVAGVLALAMLPASAAPMNNPCTQASPTAAECDPINSGNPLPTTNTLGVGVANTATGTTGAVTATLPGTTGKTTYICHVDISAAGGTANVGPITITGTLGGTLTFQIPANVSTGTAPFTWNPTPCWPASGANQSISAVTTADGTASAVDVQALGYQQ